MSTRYNVALDPPAVATGRVELNLNSGAFAVGTGVDGQGIDWGEAAIKGFMAEQQYGEALTDYRVPNRIVKIPLLLGAGQYRTMSEAVEACETARVQLQQKVALFQRQGGVLLRERPGGEPLYADIVNATLTIPDRWGEKGVEPEVLLTLECLPDFYGEEVELQPVTGSEAVGQVVAVLQGKGTGKPAVIAGDYPARARMVMTNESALYQRGCVWGVRSTFYSSGAEDALYFNAAALTPLSGAERFAESESYAGVVVRTNELPADKWSPCLELVLSGSEANLTHVGSYRVWVRAEGNAETTLRLSWAPGDTVTPTVNAGMLEKGIGWQLFDLGEIRLEQPPRGENLWNGIIEANPGSIKAIVSFDRIWLQPLDDGAGRLSATGIVSSGTELSLSSEGKGTSSESGTGTAWTSPANAARAASAGAGAKVTLAKGATSTWLEAKSLGLTLPKAAAIVGLQANFGYILSGAETPSFTFDMLKAGVPAPLVRSKAHKPPLTGTEFYGGSAQLWEDYWGAPDIENSGFGFRLSVSAGSVGPLVCYIGPMWVNVYYTKGFGSATKDAIVYPGRQAEIRFDGAYREDYATTAYVRVSEETGDLFRLPPSGMEDRQVQILCRSSSGLLPNPGTGETSGEEDGAVGRALQEVQVQVFYRPCYIGRI